MNNAINKFNELVEIHLGNIGLVHKVYVFIDVLLVKLLKQASVGEYFKYRFFEKSRYGRSKYFTAYKLRKLNKICNDYEKSMIFRDKTKFVSVFKKYVNRDALDMRIATKEQFVEFCLKHNCMFVKPVDADRGTGIHIEKCTSNFETEKLYIRLHDEAGIVEEMIVQCTELASFNDTSINSFRLVTFLHLDGRVSILPGAVLRLGRKGEVADNFHHGGICAQIDIETGMVTSVGIDKNGNRYVLHPDSGKPIVGFVVPMWDEVCKCVLEAATIVPEVHYVGWDVTVTADGKVVLIEGNNKADPDVAQMSDGIGKRAFYEPCLKEMLDGGVQSRM